MTDNMKLSQAEIDALLKGASLVEAAAPEPDLTLSDEQIDALGEIGNISFGSAATSLSTLLQHRVDITTPMVKLIHSDTVPSHFPKPYVLVAVDFTEGLKGSNALAIELKDAKTIADLMLGGDGSNVAGELNELHLSAVGEAMNQMMGGAATSMSQIFGKPINISPPTVKVVDLSTLEAMQLGLQGWIANVEFRLKVGTLIDSKIMQLVPVQFAIEMLEALGIGGASEQKQESAPVQAAPVEEKMVAPSRAEVSEPLSPTSSSGELDVATMMTAAAQVAPAAEAVREFSQPKPVLQLPIQRPEFTDFSADVQVSSPTPRNLSLLLDVPLNVTVELGRAKKVIREILDLSPGAILELDKLAGEPVDIMVNNKRIAIGEVVVIDENFGVRVTDIISPSDRVKTLQ